MPRKLKRIEHLPEAMPDVDRPTLLVVCDSHQCLFIDVGRHTLMLSGTLKSKENTFSDHEGRLQSPAAFGRGGLTSSTTDTNQLERNRLKEFANQILSYTKHAIERQGIAEWYLSAPAKLLPILKRDLRNPLKQRLQEAKEGIFVKESPRELLLRFKPELKEALQALRDQENYSPRRHLPTKAKRSRR